MYCPLQTEVLNCVLVYDGYFTVYLEEMQVFMKIFIDKQA